MKTSYIVSVICLFVIRKAHAKCHIVKSVATCESIDIPEQVYRSVDVLEIENGVKETFLPKYLFRYSKLDKLSISNCNITKISADTFVDLSCSYISLVNNSIEVIFPGAFRNLTRLDKLLIGRNKLKTIESEVFINLPISVLTLSRNSIETIEDTALKGLPNLKKLHLDNNQLDNVFVHKIIDYPSRLEILWLHNNSIKLLTNYMLKELRNLKLLNVGFNKIDTIEDATFGQTPQLDTLVLTHNLIKEMNGDVFPQKGLNFLKKLYLDHNELMFLTSRFFLRLNVLKRITLVGNPWLCPCLDDISRILYDNQIMERCQNEYNSGGKPVCISDPSQSSCTYKYNDELCNKYIQARNSDTTLRRNSYCIL